MLHFMVLEQLNTPYFIFLFIYLNFSHCDIVAQYSDIIPCLSSQPNQNTYPSVWKTLATSLFYKLLI